MRRGLAAMAAVILFGSGAEARLSDRPDCTSWDGAAWETRWAAPGGGVVEAPVQFNAPEEGRIAGTWGEAGQGGALSAEVSGARGAVLTGVWRTEAGGPGGTFRLQRAPRSMSDPAYIRRCHFEGRYTIEGQSGDFLWEGWRIAPAR